MRVAIVPARGGSQRIPGKNTKPFMGKPMILWPLEAAVRSDLFDSIIVSTDSDAIAKLVSGRGCEVVMREPDDGATGTQEIAARVLDARPEFDQACVIYPCSPMLTPADLHETYSAWQRRPDRFLSTAVRVGDFEASDAGCLYWGLASSFRARQPYENGPGFNHFVHLVDPARFIDINTPEDWARAESMFNALHP